MAIKDSATADRLCAERFTRMRDVFIVAPRFEYTFPLGWSSLSFSEWVEVVDGSDGGCQ
jgi:hypothetical protein